MKKIISTILNIVAMLTVFIGVSLVFPNKAEAACQVVLDSSFRFRTSANNGGGQPDNWYSASNPPFVYVDIKTTGCTADDNLYLTIYGIQADSFGVELTQLAIQPWYVTLGNWVFGPDGNNFVTKAMGTIQLSGGDLDEDGGVAVALKPTERVCFGAQSDTSNADCLITAIITDVNPTQSNSKILAALGDMVGPIGLQQAQVFNNFFANGTPEPLQGCLNYAGWFYRVTQSCDTAANGWNYQDFPNGNQKFIDYYNTYYLGNLGNQNLVLQTSSDIPSATLAFPALYFRCDGVCDIADPAWSLQGLFSYGATNPNDAGPQTVDPLSEIYQEEYAPLAPLPFEGLDGGATPTLGSYLAGLFRAGIVIVIVLSVIMIVFHGISYATVNAITGKQDHKEGVLNAIYGLLLALGSWFLLNTISPRLASELSIGVPEVSLEGDAESISVNNVQYNGPGGGTLTGFTLPNNLNLYCPGSGGISEIPQIIDSFTNKVTYRWGGKGGSLPTGQSYALSPNEQNGGAYMCTNSSGQTVPCRTFCPGDSVCLDCSGFVNHVRQCAGLSIYSGTSSMVGNSNAIQVDMNTLSSNGQSLTVNGSPYTLQPGDLLVWNGHVVIYYGNGIIAESKGDLASIQNPNQNIKKTSLATSKYKKKITHIIKAIP